MARHAEAAGRLQSVTWYDDQMQDTWPLLVKLASALREHQWAEGVFVHGIDARLYLQQCSAMLNSSLDSLFRYPEVRFGLNC